MVYYVYLLKCYNKRGQYKIYTGYTNNAKRRLQEHREGRGAKFTKMYNKKIELAYTETYRTRGEAMRREWYIKHKLTRKEKLELIKLEKKNWGPTESLLSP